MAVCSLLWLSVRLGTRLRYKLSRRDQRRGFQPQRFSRTAREFPAQSAYLQSIPPSAKTMSTYLTPSSSRSVHPCLCQLIYCSTAYSQAHVCQSTLQYAKIIAPTDMPMPIHLQPSSCLPIYSMPSLSLLQPCPSIYSQAHVRQSTVCQAYRAYSHEPRSSRLQRSSCPFIYSQAYIAYRQVDVHLSTVHQRLFIPQPSSCPLIYSQAYIAYQQVDVHLSTSKVICPTAKFMSTYLQLIPHKS